MILAPLAFLGRHGRWSLIAGLLGGLTLPGVALAMKPWLPELIGLLICVSAFRIGPRATLGTRSDLFAGLRRVMIYQLIAPIVALALFAALGILNHPAALATILVLAAPSVSGAPNFAIMMGRDPQFAMRLLLLGTALFPLTVVPVLLLLPAVPTLEAVMESAGRLLAVLGLAVSLGFLLRRDTQFTDVQRQATDGLAALLLAIIVIGLMSAVGPALTDAPLTLLGWLAFALTLNFGLQIAAYLSLGPDTGAAIVAGNRNIALFLVALSPEVTDQLLMFIGCYQIPMFITPIVMARVMRSGH